MRWVVLGVMMIVVRWATVVRPSGLRLQGFRGAFGGPSGGLRGFVRLNFKVTIPGVSGVSNPGLLI